MKTIPGINIQWPWSELILSGQKTIETRSYPIPKKHLGKELAIIQTPGPLGKPKGLKTEIVGTVVFSESVQYMDSNAWKKDASKHLVAESDPQFAFNPRKPKWGWIVKSVAKLQETVRPPKKRGIVFAKGCKVPR